MEMNNNSNGFKIFVAEDNEWYNKLISHHLSLNPDFEVKSFFSGKDLLDALHENPQVITIDYRLPDMLGDELLSKILAFNKEIKVIVISEQDEIEIAVELLKSGARDYIVKGKSIQERLINIINSIKTTASLKTEIQSLKKEVRSKYGFEKTMIGTSNAIQTIMERMTKATQTNINVSITGETGTGKEVTAKAIHYNSYCANDPFVAINMAAIPENLLESELFGHEKGAFTGAVQRRIGKFEEAGNGTLFLDEIGEMNINFQAKLLRVLQEREITRIGGNKSVKINCRIIVATNLDLKEETKNKKFREDLYFRLIGLPIHLPPLRERGKDILLLAHYFIQKFCTDNNIETKTLSETAQQKLMAYQWPGNIRELKSVIDLSIVLSNKEKIESDDISLSDEDALPEIMSKETSMREYNRRIVEIYMANYGNDTKLVAQKLDIGQTTVYRLLNEIKNQ